MKKITTLLLVLTLNSLSNINAGNVWIKVNIDGCEDTKAKFGLMPVHGDGKELKTKINMSTGELVEIDLEIDKLYFGKILSEEMYFQVEGRNRPLRLNGRTIEFYAEPNDTLIIEGKLKELSVDYTVTGNKINRQLTEYRKEYLPLKENKVAEYLKFAEYEAKTKDKDSIKAFWKNNYFETAHKRLWLESVKFVDNHIDYEFSPYLLSSLISLDSLLMYKNRFPEEVLNGDIGKDFQEMVQYQINKKKYVAEENAPNFRFTTISGEEMQLTDFNGEFIVLDFWGSWCLP